MNNEHKSTKLMPTWRDSLPTERHRYHPNYNWMHTLSTFFTSMLSTA